MAELGNRAGHEQGALIEVEGVKRIYRLPDVEVRALRGVDFYAEAGDFIAIMGPSGSGKSTLMNILGCLDKPSEGSYRLDGIETTGLDATRAAAIRNRKIGFVFQAFNLLARTPALENVERPLLYCRPGENGGSANFGKRPTNGKERKDRAAAMLREVGLADRMNHLPNQLSGGEQQRVAIARAIVNDPAFILADEPTGNLDTETSLEILSLFQELNRRGKTIIMVSHEREYAAYARRIVTMRDGRIASDKKLSRQADAACDLQKWREQNAVEGDEQ
jgi:putative ABC transport system ATP-binding protein